MSQLLSTLWFPWPQRLKVTRWGHCSQHFSHQPRCEFLTFLFVLFLSNIKVPNIVLDTYIVIKVLLNFNNLLLSSPDFRLIVNKVNLYNKISLSCSDTSADANCCLCVFYFSEINCLRQTKPPWTDPDFNSVSLITCMEKLINQNPEPPCSVERTKLK